MYLSIGDGQSEVWLRARDARVRSQGALMRSRGDRNQALQVVHDVNAGKVPVATESRAQAQKAFGISC